MVSVDVKHHVYSDDLGEPVWPSGKALGWEVAEAGPRFDTASALLSLQKGCGLWTLSCDCPSLLTETVKWLSSLPIAGIILVVTVLR